ncbi:hypothetical protein [Neolewinella agarilytica]|uniref:Uncharacterized protein n=1 Tax=Neolewinella agarilytica TaxID=478744 RepID=A0A1H9CBR3_9BACT|nr:hypothetical protein [Neolewinella agarilytica]SEP98128.1 hypothetical protein SAMN05444359_104124 [Neolewinella agarilytica]
MKLFRSLIFVTCLCFGAIVCAQSSTGEVRYVSSPEKGIIVLEANGYGKKKAVAFEDATVKSFKVLLKSGIPGSSQYLPLLGANAHQVYAGKTDFFEQFFADKTYLEFLVDQRRGNFSRRARKTDPNVKVRLAINVPSLRRYLEGAGALRKFGL